MYIFDRSAVCVHGRTTIKLELVPILVPRTASHEKKFIFVKLQDNVFYLVLLWSSSETQGRSVRSGEKAGRKFSSTGERAPRDRLLPNYFQKFKRMPAADWAQKMLCFIVPNRRTVLFVSSYTTAIASPPLPGLFTKLVRARETFIFYFPNQKRNYQ